jgi:predicted dehydrogenase
MLKFAIIGCGRISKRHCELLGLGQIPGAKLVAVADVQLDRAKATGERFNIPYYQDFHEMLKKEDIDVVTILTPSGLHAEHAIAVSQYKKHIVVEKPMALTLEDADKMTAAAKNAGVELFVVKQNRFNVPVVRLRQELESGRFGKLVMGTVRVRWCRDQAYYDQDAWRGTWAQDGGAFANQASHHVDLLQWMMGDVESVFAKGGTFLVDTETEDTGIAMIKFKNGALGVIEATTACRPKDLEGSVSILGERGSVEISGFAVNEMRHWNFSPATQEDQNIIKNYSVNPPNVYGYGHKAYLEHVVECLTTGKKSFLTGVEGKKSLELIIAIYESMESGKEVRYPFKPEKCKLGRKS